MVAAPEADAKEDPGVLSPAAINALEQGSGIKAGSSGKENTPRRAKKGREYRKSDLEVCLNASASSSAFIL